MRVDPDKQTLILAGEAAPPRRTLAGRGYAGDTETGPPLRRVTMLLVQGEYADAPLVLDQSVVPHSSTARGPSTGAAQYARTQTLSGASARIQLIDTYA